MHSKRDNIDVITYDNGNEVVKEIFDSILSRYQIGLETSMKGSDFIFDTLISLYYKCLKINFKRGSSYIDSRDWIKNKKATTNSKRRRSCMF